MIRRDNFQDQFKDPEILTLEANLWKEVCSTFERKRIFPFSGSVDIRPLIGDTQRMVLAISAIFLSYKVHSVEGEFFVPLNWWEHFKQRWFPEWLKLRYPVRKEVITYTQSYYNLCPHLDIEAGSSEGKHVHLDFLKFGNKESKEHG